MTPTQIARKARERATVEADAFMAKLNLGPNEQQFVLLQVGRIVDLLEFDFTKLEAKGVYLTPEAISSALAVACHLTDRINHHVQKLLEVHGQLAAKETK